MYAENVKGMLAAHFFWRSALKADTLIDSNLIAGKGGGSKSTASSANVQDARKEMTKTKEQLEEEKKISLSIRIKPLDVEAMDSDQLMDKVKELWTTIVHLETEKYDLEERQKRQDYDVSRWRFLVHFKVTTVDGVSGNYGQMSAPYHSFISGDI